MRNELLIVPHSNLELEFYSRQKNNQKARPWLWLALYIYEFFFSRLWRVWLFAIMREIEYYEEERLNKQFGTSLLGVDEDMLLGRVSVKRPALLPRSSKRRPNVERRAGAA